MSKTRKPSALDKEPGHRTMAEEVAARVALGIGATYAARMRLMQDSLRVMARVTLESGDHQAAMLAISALDTIEKLSKAFPDPGYAFGDPMSPREG